MLMDRTQWYILVGKKIVTEVEMEKINECFVALLASFYLFDFDYPRSHDITLHLLQHCIFKDMNIPQDIAPAFQAATKSYKSFKSV